MAERLTCGGNGRREAAGVTERRVDWSWHRIGYREACRRFTPEARALLLAFAALGVAYGAFTTLFTLYLVALGFDEAFIGVLTAVGALSGAVASTPAGMLYDRLGPRPALLRGLIASASGIGIECVVLGSHCCCSLAVLWQRPASHFS